MPKLTVTHQNCAFQTGQNHVAVENLPNSLLEDSIRAEGCAHATIFDVIYKPPTHVYHSNTPEISRLREERNVLNAKLARTNAQSKVLTVYSDTLTAESTAPEKLGEFLQIFDATESRLHVERAETNRKIRRIDDNIQALQKAANVDDGSKKRRTQIAIVVFADRDGQAEITLSYGMCCRSHAPCDALNNSIFQS